MKFCKSVNKRLGPKTIKTRRYFKMEGILRKGRSAFKFCRIWSFTVSGPSGRQTSTNVNSCQVLFALRVRWVWTVTPSKLHSWGLSTYSGLCCSLWTERLQACRLPCKLLRNFFSKKEKLVFIMRISLKSVCRNYCWSWILRGKKIEMHTSPECD